MFPAAQFSMQMRKCDTRLQVVTKLTKTSFVLISLAVVSGEIGEHGALVPQTVATAIIHLSLLKNTEPESVGVQMMLDVMLDMIKVTLI